MVPSGASNRLLALDGLRLLCCASVVIAHANWGPFMARLAALGVDVFFVLSGFVITRLLLEELATAGTISLAAFYERRARRILPVYYACLLAGFGLSWLWGEPFTRVFRGPDSPGLDTALAYIFFVGNFTHGPVPAPIEVLWSVCIEEQFYLVFPLILSRVRGRLPALAPALVGLLLAWGTRWWLAHRGDTDLFRNPLAHADGLLCGVLLAQFSRATPAALVLRGRRAMVAEGGALLLVLLHLFFRPTSSAPWSYVYSFFASALAGTALIGALAGSGGPVATWLSRRPVVALGRLTYGGYAIHMYAVVAAWGAAARLPLGAAEIPARFALALLGTFGLAWLVEHTIARPFHKPGGVELARSE